MATEEWKAIPGYEDLYEASSLGRIRSLDREVERMTRWGKLGKFILKGRILKPHVNKKGYNYVSLGACNSKEVHYWVASAFLGPRLPFIEVNHKDLNKSNNAISNLEYVTREENKQHAVHNGHHNKSVLTPSIVLELKQRRAAGERVSALAKEFKVDRHTITSAVAGRTWRWV